MRWLRTPEAARALRHCSRELSAFSDSSHWLRPGAKWSKIIARMSGHASADADGDGVIYGAKCRRRQ